VLNRNLLYGEVLVLPRVYDGTEVLLAREHCERMTAVVTVSIRELASGLGVCICRPHSQEGGGGVYLANQEGPSCYEGYSVIRNGGEGLKGILAENVVMLLSPIGI
jgi:hypothetical protein